jgi:serine protease AprX
VGLRNLDYVSKNTYLCYYQPTDLQKIRQMDPVVYVDIYRRYFKTVPSLNEAVTDRDYKIDVIFHLSVQTDSVDLRDRISEATRSAEKDMEFFKHKVRLTISGQYIHDTAMLDDVRCIEKVARLIPCNDRARLIMGLDNHQDPRLGQEQLYEGKG